MGISVNYNTIPPQSGLYQRLQREKPLAVLMTDLFRCGQIYRFFEIDPDEHQEILQWVFEDHRDTFESLADTQRWFAEFAQELERTRAQYPGIEARTASLEKTSDIIEHQLRQHFATEKGKTGEAIVDRLLFGDETLAGHFMRGEKHTLGLVSRKVLREGTRLLEGLGAEKLFRGFGDGLDAKELFRRYSGRDQTAREHYTLWRRLYSVAADKGELIVVGMN
jgi:hypothetical protein